MSDIAPEVTPEVAPTITPQEAPVADVDPFDDAEVTTFKRDYVQKLRDEAASRRTAIKPYEDAFGKYNDDERAVWFGLAQELVTSPKTAAEKFQQIANEILGVDSTAGDTKETPADPAKAQFLTQADLEAKLTEIRTADEQERAVKDATDRIVSEGTTLGYKQGTAEWRELMVAAQYETAGDLAKAHEAIAARKQAVIDSFLAEKAGQPGIRTPRAGGETPSQAQPITSFQDARSALEARLAAM